MSIHLYNTLTRAKEPFVPGEPGQVKIYVCGPTTYNLIHLGNARPLVFFDTVRRYFTFRGYKVTYIQNFTNVDDKIIQKAREAGEEPLSLAERYINEFFQDARALNVQDADVHPKVSDHLPEIVALIETLVEKGAAYEAEGNVYFSVRNFADYGKLSGRSLDELQAGARIEIDARKKDPLDFALWKKAKPGELAWPSPWGEGRPGWHIECSAMSYKYLGPQFDIHGGGADLVFPHHENEIAQSEMALERPFARYWMHNGFITINQEKMSKSLGNFFLVREILAQFPAQVIRFFLLETHYRSPLDFDDQKLAASAKALGRIKKTKELLQEQIAHLPETAAGDGAGELDRHIDRQRQAFIAAMDDDFNTALALAAVFELCREANSFAHRADLATVPGARSQLGRVLQTLEELVEDVLGIPWQQDEPQDRPGDTVLVKNLIELLIELRQQARAQKDWETADAIRRRLKETGILLEDTPYGVRWQRDGK